MGDNFAARNVLLSDIIHIIIYSSTAVASPYILNYILGTEIKDKHFSKEYKLWKRNKCKRSK